MSFFTIKATLTFSEESEQYGWDDIRPLPAAVFLDFDKDERSRHVFSCLIQDRSVVCYDLRLGQREERKDRRSGNKLLSKLMAITYTDVSEAAGIYAAPWWWIGYVTVADLKRILGQTYMFQRFFIERDYLYLNNQNGYISEMLPENCSPNQHGIHWEPVWWSRQWYVPGYFCHEKCSQQVWRRVKNQNPALQDWIKLQANSQSRLIITNLPEKPPGSETWVSDRKPICPFDARSL